jgi:1,4-dihydroxy-2-naphthoate octaprenyltransferase
MTKSSRLSVAQWVQGARPKTLPLAFAPVIVGSASAWWAGGFSWALSALALVVAVSLQVGVNFANDYSDGVRGTDNYRVGPARLTGSGEVAPRVVLAAAVLSFAVAALAGLALVIASESWWLLGFGVVSLVAAWFYTGGKRPYGYLGLGEVVVFLFFGLVATIGTAYVQVGRIPDETWLAGSALGFVASAVLLVNNLRDVDQDAQAGKHTLAVKVGKRWSQVIITGLLVAPFGVVAVLSLVFLNAPFAFFALLLVAPTVLIVWTYRGPRDLIIALQLMSFTSVTLALLLGWAIAF